MIEQLIRTPFTELTGVRHPVVQTGMGWVSGPRLVSGTANAGGLGILASATMTFTDLEKAILEVKSRTDRPFGVNLRADAGDAADDRAIAHDVEADELVVVPGVLFGCGGLILVDPQDRADDALGRGAVVDALEEDDGVPAHGHDSSVSGTRTSSATATSRG